MDIWMYLDNRNKRKYLSKIIKELNKELKAGIFTYGDVKEDKKMAVIAINMNNKTREEIKFYQSKLNELL